MKSCTSPKFRFPILKAVITTEVIISLANVEGPAVGSKDGSTIGSGVGSDEGSTDAVVSGPEEK